MTFGDKILQLRKAKHFSQQRVATDLQVSQTLISAYEIGRVSPTMDVVRDFAKYYGVHPISLLSFDDIEDADQYWHYVAAYLLNHPKQKQLFELTKDFADADLDVVLAVAKSIAAKGN